jgi:hypothetical protein
LKHGILRIGAVLFVLLSMGEAVTTTEDDGDHPTKDRDDLPETANDSWFVARYFYCSRCCDVVPVHNVTNYSLSLIGSFSRTFYYY